MTKPNPLCNSSGGASFDKKEFKRNFAGSVSYPPVYTVVCTCSVSVRLKSVFFHEKANLPPTHIRSEFFLLKLTKVPVPTLLVITVHHPKALNVS